MRARAALALAALAAACDRPSPPPAGRAPGASAAAPGPAASGPDAPGAPGGAEGGAPAGSGAGVAAGASGRRPAVGGAWVGCVAGFRRSGRPDGDAGRLGEACAGRLGLERIGAWRGELREGERAAHALELRAGDCVRLLAVGGPGLDDLGLSLSDGAGRAAASDGGDDGWPLVPPDGTACVRAGGPYAVEVRARRGGGAWAAEAWRLP